jgi:hypothetical protein
MESGFDPLKVKVRETPAWVPLGVDVPSLTIPFQLLKRYYMEMFIVHCQTNVLHSLQLVIKKYKCKLEFLF